MPQVHRPSVSNAEVSFQFLHGFVVEYVVDESHAFVAVERARAFALWRHDASWLLPSEEFMRS